MRYAILDGHRIVQTGEAPDDLIALQGGDLPSMPVPEGIGQDSHYWDGAGFLPYPPRPHDWLEFDPATGSWFDPRDAAKRDAELHQARDKTQIEKGALYLALARGGFLPWSDLDGAHVIPPTIEAWFATLPEPERSQIRGTHIYEPLVWRLHPHVLALAASSFMPMTDDQLDRVFGVPVPEPLYQPADPEAGA